MQWVAFRCPCGMVDYAPWTGEEAGEDARGDDCWCAACLAQLVGVASDVPADLD